MYKSMHVHTIDCVSTHNKKYKLKSPQCWLSSLCIHASSFRHTFRLLFSIPTIDYSFLFVPAILGLPPSAYCQTWTQLGCPVCNTPYLSFHWALSHNYGRSKSFSLWLLSAQWWVGDYSNHREKALFQVYIRERGKRKEPGGASEAA